MCQVALQSNKNENLLINIVQSARSRCVVLNIGLCGEVEKALNCTFHDVLIRIRDFYKDASH